MLQTVFIKILYVSKKSIQRKSRYGQFRYKSPLKRNQQCIHYPHSQIARRNFKQITHFPFYIYTSQLSQKYQQTIYRVKVSSFSLALNAAIIQHSCLENISLHHIVVRDHVFI